MYCSMFSSGAAAALRTMTSSRIWPIMNRNSSPPSTATRLRIGFGPGIAVVTGYLATGGTGGLSGIIVPAM